MLSQTRNDRWKRCRRFGLQWFCNDPAANGARMALKIPLCLFNRHRPLSGSVSWDGTGYVGTCQHCGKPILRERRHVWRQVTCEAA